MSTVNLTDGVLLVQGDALTSNKISLSLTEDGSQIQARIGKQIVQKVALDTVDQIEIRGGLKADRITIDKGITINATIYGDAGNDTIVAGGGVDAIYGGLGADRVTLSYVDTIYDLEGKNTITRVAGAAPMTRNDDTLIESYTPTYFDPTVYSSDTPADDDADMSTEIPVVDSPAIETPVDETSVVETPVDETPVTETPTGEVTPPIEEPVAPEAPTVPTDPVDQTPNPTPGGVNAASVTTPGITGLTLYDAVTDNELYALNNGDTIDLAALANKGLTVVANTNGYVKSVKFGYDAKSNYRVENGAPYALNSNTGANFHAWTPTVGTHTITVTGYSATSATGTASAAYTVTFTVVNNTVSTPTTPTTPPASPSVTTPVINSLTLIDAVTNKDLYQLSDGATINLATLANRGLNIRANVNSSVTAVKFGYDANASYAMENAAPYTLAGDTANGTDYYAWTPTVGTHTLTVTGYTVDNGGGTASAQYTVTFTVTDTVTTTPPPTTPPPTTTPPAPLPGDTPTTGVNQAPTVSFINPTNGSSQASPGHYVIRVNAADADGSVKKVEFFSNGNLISSTIDAPYSAAWVNVSAGTYTLTARATDDDGATKSTSISVTINNPTVDQTFYVSTSGNDTASGSSSAPLRSISKAAALAGPGDVIIIRPGTYRESITINTNGTATAPITFKAEQPGTVVIDGADPVTGWTQVGTSNVYSADWAYDFFFSGTSRTHGSPAEAGYAEQFFYKNENLKQVFSQSAVTAGTFYVNWSTDKVYIQLPDNTNPSNSQILGSTRQSFFKTTKSGGLPTHITLDGLTFRHAANFAQKAALRTNTGWVLKNSTIEDVNAGGLGVYGTDNFIYNNIIQDNGQAGMIGQGVNALIVDNTVRANNWKHFSTGWDGGGGKMARTDGLYLLNHDTYGNYGAGFWLDVYNTNYTIDGGFFHDNKMIKQSYEGMGIELEINNGPGKVINASFYGNSGAGITIAESSDVIIRGNFLADNLELRNMADRTPGLKRIGIYSNNFKGAQIANSIGTWTSTSLKDLSIKADFNRYDNGTGAIWRWRGTSYYTTNIYSSLGLEQNATKGSVTIPLA